ncbi:MAG: NAD(P)H-binding protein [Capnocytophaga sp.]|nr:NAD(P)H-binding protein [Capnocytophaga sp.]
MKAIVIGATGATGCHVVQALLDDSLYSEVRVFVRREMRLTHPKLKVYVIDFEKINEYESEIQGDVFYSCLGTTLKAAGSQTEQWKTDHDIPLQFAAIAHRNRLNTCVLVSAYGADVRSKLFYNRMKGALEEAVVALGFERCIIFKPGILEREDSDRIGEKIGVELLRFCNHLGIFRRYRPLRTQLLAEKLVLASHRAKAGVTILELDAISSYEE